jgi:hypothetical protein
MVPGDDDLVEMRPLRQPLVEGLDLAKMALHREVTGVNEHIAIGNGDVAKMRVGDADDPHPLSSRTSHRSHAREGPRGLAGQILLGHLSILEGPARTWIDVV